VLVATAFTAAVGCAGSTGRPVDATTTPRPVDSATQTQSAPVTLQLPSRGLAVEVAPHRVRLYSVTGRPIALVRAEVANYTVSLHPWLVDRFGRKLALTGGRMTFGDVHGDAPGPGHRPHFHPPLGEKGHGGWEMAAPSPDGRWVLGQWSGECEVPTAYLINAHTGHITEIGERSSGLLPESLALGWMSNTRALVHFPQGACGTSVPRPGIYVVGSSGVILQRIVATRMGNRAYMWGG
jgi:hypothetical protein